MGRRTKKRAQNSPATNTPLGAADNHRADSSEGQAPQPAVEKQSAIDIALWLASAVCVVIFFQGWYFLFAVPLIVVVASFVQLRHSTRKQRPARVARVVLCGVITVMMGIGFYLVHTGSQAPVPEEFKNPPQPTQSR
ncbi:hypothetical protein [Corynebacterium aquilae]|uniref:Uncharacterized protein n=1 Tax=Corynebacterium aquilae DSM 44791 TaxID=1431546 RepID=A0A1L7CE51_9CORY|nr:hypothetical protein [Corynebacterium aquilae]APT84107.1 hypothetical protein CAQU_02385 [Corynebacterium aquilae DSM 44791]